MNLLHIIVPILVGGVIGYCTNYLAIKMLFRPHKAIYIGKFHLPFTPGLIPKNQKRLAGAIGDAVSEQLLTKEAMLESVADTGKKYISQIAANIFDSDINIMKMLPKQTDSEDIIESASASISKKVMEKANQMDIEFAVSGFGKDAMSSMIASAPMLAMLLNEDKQMALCEKLSKAVRGYLNEHGEETVQGFVLEYIRELAEKPLGEIVPEKENQERITYAIESALKSVAVKHGADILDQIDIRGIVSARIEEMDMDELEELVLSVMKQELQAVINLGALIGAVIGIINIFL